MKIFCFEGWSVNSDKALWALVLPIGIRNEVSVRYQATEDRIRTLLIWSVPVTVLGVSPFFTFDPINLIKQTSISIFAFSALSLALFCKPLFQVSSKLKILFSSVFFGLLIPIIFSDSPLELQFWGIFGRSNGYLSYLSLFILAFLAYRFANEIMYKRLTGALFITLILLSSYGFVQWARLDPVKWSQFDVFGTLGNVNFMSAMLGMLIVIPICSFLNKKSSSKLRLISLVSMILTFFVLWKTHSLQGLVVISFELTLLVLIRCFANRKWIVGSSVMSTAIASGIIAIYGLFNRGPFASFLYQDTNVFRADYMGAAWRTFLHAPLTGVGHDSYDGWYRYFRGFISAFRTTPNRTTNSAHNIFLDMAANCGLLLILSYVLLVLLSMFYGFKVLLKFRKGNKQELFHFEILFIVWMGYVLQSLFSINQIGVGVVGWVLLGTVLSIERNMITSLKLKEEETSNQILKVRSAKKNSARKNSPTSLPAKHLLTGILGTCVALTASLPPLITDHKYKVAFQSASLNNLIAVADELPATAFHLSNIVSVGIKSGYGEQVLPIARELVRKYPRDPFGWRALFSLSGSTHLEKEKANTELRKIEPLYSCLDAAPELELLRTFKNLELDKRIELLKWWGFIPRNEAHALALQQSVGISDSTIMERLKTAACG